MRFRVNLGHPSLTPKLLYTSNPQACPNYSASGLGLIRKNSRHTGRRHQAKNHAVRVAQNEKILGPKLQESTIGAILRAKFVTPIQPLYERILKNDPSELLTGPSIFWKSLGSTPLYMPKDLKKLLNQKPPKPKPLIPQPKPITLKPKLLFVSGLNQSLNPQPRVPKP